MCDDEVNTRLSQEMRRGVTAEHTQLTLKMASIKQLETEIKKIKERNKRVEADKAWETSWTRRILIVVLTYIVIVLFFYFAELPKPWINSIVPALAFLLSTLTLQVFKRIWIRNK